MDFSDATIDTCKNCVIDEHPRRKKDIRKKHDFSKTFVTSNRATKPGLLSGRKYFDKTLTRK